MSAILELNVVRAEFRRYEVSSWGVGELWVRDGVVLAHDFDFGLDSGEGVDGPEVDDDLVVRLRAFFRGDHVRFDDVPLDLDPFTPFQRAVATQLRALPRGETVSYGELAALAGYPGAQRAVGSFCARNRFMILVPCHRVVSASGIGPYGSSGTSVKRRLLALEGVSL
jgi:methylated-DNA-[protein]-cysteine S-methyltransferase